MDVLWRLFFWGGLSVCLSMGPASAALNSKVDSSAIKVHRATVMVVGVSRQMDGKWKKEWDDFLVGFGIQQLIAEKLFDAGCQLMEENRDVKHQVYEFSKLMWTMEGKENFQQKLDGLAQHTDADWIAWGAVESFSIQNSRRSIGLIYHNDQTAKVRIRLSLKQVQSGIVYETVAEGKSTRTAHSVLFVFNEEIRGKINFDETAVGAATKQAVEQAVAQLKNEGHLPQRAR